jgi:hypothetical protein
MADRRKEEGRVKREGGRVRREIRECGRAAKGRWREQCERREGVGEGRERALWCGRRKGTCP